MKVIFLDIDGVLNDLNRLAVASKSDVVVAFKFGELLAHLDPALMFSLNRIVNETGAKVVISSSWRKILSKPQLIYLFEEAGFSGEIIALLPSEESYGVKFRGEAINKWLEENEVSGYICIDDDVDDYMKNVVQTSSRRGGLTFEKAEEAIKKLTTGGRCGSRQ